VLDQLLGDFRPAQEGEQSMAGNGSGSEFGNGRHMTRRTIMKGTGAALGAIALAGDAGSVRATRAQNGGVLRIAFSDALATDNLNPAMLQDNFFIVPPQGLLYESLVRLDNDFQPQPQLAEDWESSDDNTTWVFHLRQGVEFHDGSTMTAEDVVWSLQAAMDPDSASNLYAQLRTLLLPENITAIDDYTVQFVLESPFVFFANPLGIRNARIFKAGYTSADFETDPIGTGPFRYQAFEPGQSFSAIRFENYWQTGKPYLDEVNFINVPESASKMEALLTGEVDLIDNIEFATSRQLDGTDYEPLALEDAAWHAAICDTTVSPFDDPRVILAMKLALDRQQVVDIVYAGYASVAADSPIPTSDPYFPDDLQPRERDVEAARELLADAGYPDGLTIEHPLMTVFGFGTNNLAAVLREQFAEAGIEISIQEGGPTFWDTVWQQAPFYIPDYNRRHPAEIFPLVSVTNAGQWMTNWSNAEFDASVEAAAQTTDFEVQKEEYGRAIRLQSENDGIILPAYASRLHAKSKRLQGVVPNFVSFFDFTDASFD
jgi:peptide/nickel transport system substrate-binding protein